MENIRENLLRNIPENTRKILFEGIGNARDLGGLRTGSGDMIRKGTLIRSANLSAATETDVKMLLEQYRLLLVIDLRTPMAAGMKPDIPIPGVRYEAIPVFEDVMIGVTHERDRDYAHRKTRMPDLGNLYERIVTEEACRQRLGKVIRLIMSQDFQSGSVLWHCSEGKDRCGLISAFLLYALDVDEDVILEDYLMTNEAAIARADDYYRKVLENGGDEQVARSVWNAFVVKEEYLRGALNAIRRSWGDMRSYLTDGLQIPEDLIAAFRQAVLIKEPGDPD